MNAGEPPADAADGPEVDAAHMPFGARLRRHRLAAGLTQEELAERAGLSARGIQDLERGVRSTPQRETVRLLAQALGLTADEAASLAAVPRARAGRSRLRVNAVAERPARPGAALPGDAAWAGTEPASFRPPSTSFIGRQREVAALCERLSRRDVRLLTLTGPGGVGKSRLAFAAAAASGAAYPGGVWPVDLAPVRDAALVLPAVAHAVGVREGADRSVLAALRDRVADRAVLLVLDNFEHLLAAAPAVADLLGACPHLTVLATSRAPLRLAGEHEFPVPPLAVPDPGGGEDPAQSEAVALFAARAQAVRPDFVVTAETAAIVVEICRRLDGLPLAIELAAARMRAFSPAALRAQLRQRLPLLTSGPRDAPARQRTLRDTVAWSYALLSPGEQAFFRRLAVFAGGCTPESAAAVAAPHPGDGDDAAGVLDWLLALTEQSLLQPADTRGGAGGIGGSGGDSDTGREPRFTLLETVREFAAERLDETPEADAVRERHATYFVAFAERAMGERGSGRDLASHRDLEAEHANLRAALEWALRRGAVERALRLAGPLGAFWANTGRFAEGRALLARVLAMPQEPAAQAVRGLVALANVVRAAGGLAYSQGDYAAAAPLLDEGLALARAAGDTRALLGALRARGLLARRLGDYAAAQALVSESVALARHEGLGAAAGPGLALLGVLAFEGGAPAAARPLLEEALAAARATGTARGTALALLVLGRVALAERDFPAARARLAESLALYRELDDPIYFAEHFEAWGEAAALQGQPLRALRLAGAAAAVRSRTGIAPTPHGERTVAEWAAAARGAVGEGQARAAWAAGESMPIAEAIAYALADAEQRSPAG